MKAQKSEKKPREKKPREKKARPPQVGQTNRLFWPTILAVFTAIFVVFEVYSPVLRGPFLFDDDYLPFRRPDFPDDLRHWMGGVRPLLMFTYWVNFRISPEDTFFYHVVNVLLHLGAGALVFLILRRVLALAGVPEDRGRLLGAFGAGVFLLHPVQTESVAYVASRSENLSVFLFLAAFAVFLCRRAEAISWLRAGAVLLLFAGALASKEHTLVLPALLLLADYYSNPGFSLQGIRRNWRLYLPMAGGAAAGLAMIWSLLFHADTAGFGVKEIAWYEYFFTECRALFVYLRLLVLPYGQTVDYDFPFSRTLWEHGAVFGLAALVVITGAAWFYRRRWPLASFGWFAFLILMAPTSSVMPIHDPVAERRLYLAMPALLIIAMEPLRRVELNRRVLAVLAAVLAVSGVLTYNRNQVWRGQIALWEDAVEKAPRKVRPRFQLAYALFAANRCEEALPHYRIAAELEPPRYDLLVDWALAHDCLNQSEEALEKLRRAALLEDSAHVHSLMGMVYAKQSRWQEALKELATAETIDPNYAMTYVYRGGVRLAQGDAAAAVAEYRRALAIEPQNSVAAQALATAQGRLQAR